MVFLLLPLAGNAQEGHPIKGTWRGEIDMGADSRALVMIMDYDGDNITGMINPGRTSYRFSSADLDAPNWVLSASATNRDGVDISFMATLHDIGARSRYLEGTWTEGGSSYPFRVNRE
jgi:hypothetical protein